QSLSAELAQGIEEFRQRFDDLVELARSGSTDFLRNERLKRDLVRLGEALRPKLLAIIDGRESDGRMTLRTYTLAAQSDVELTFCGIQDILDGNWGLDSFGEYRSDEPRLGERTWN